MVVPKKNDTLHICIDFWEHCHKKGLVPLPFINEVLDKVMNHEVYSLLDVFSKYDQIQIAPEALQDDIHYGLRNVCVGSNAIWTQECTYLPKSNE